jgi:two-component system, NarL family, nitrate/nitrite response regulator NarL
MLLTGPAGLFREGLAMLLRGFASGVEVLASDRLEENWPDARRPDCIVMDGDAPPDPDAADATGELVAVRYHAMTTPVVVLLDDVRRERVDALIAAGVSGCVEKSASSELLFSALRLAFAGGVYLPRALLARSLHEREEAMSSGDYSPRRLPFADVHQHLTPRQIEVLALLARGRSNKMIARQLEVTEATVKTHLTTIFRVLNVSSRGEASVVAARMEKIRTAQAARAIDGHFALGKLLANMGSRRYRAGDVLFHKGDASGAMFYIERGTVRIDEIGIEMGAGSVLGEIGVFTPERRRTTTVVCKTDCEMRTVSAAEAIQLYYQEPEFALYLLHLIASRLQADTSRRG